MINNPVICNPEIQHKKAYEKYLLGKKSNGLGFFILSYVLTMLFSSTFLNLLFTLFTPGSIDLEHENPGFYLFEIFVMVLSAFLPSLFYIVFSKSDLNEIIKCKYVKPSFLVPLVFIGMGTAMFANYAGNILITNFSLFGLENHIDFSKSSSSLLCNLLYIVSTAVVPAFAEEFAFRGIIMGSLRKYGDAFAIIVSAVMFGAMHGNIVQIPFAFILGLIFAYVDCKTNSILPSIIIHFLNNFYAVIFDILSSEGIVSESVLYIINYVTIAAFCLLGLISFIIINHKNKSFWKISDKNDNNNIYAKSLSIKEKNIAFFTAPGVIASLLLFLLETVIYLIMV